MVCFFFNGSFCIGTKKQGVLCSIILTEIGSIFCDTLFLCFCLKLSLDLNLVLFVYANLCSAKHFHIRIRILQLFLWVVSYCLENLMHIKLFWNVILFQRFSYFYGENGRIIIFVTKKNGITKPNCFCNLKS